MTRVSARDAKTDKKHSSIGSDIGKTKSSTPASNNGGQAPALHEPRFFLGAQNCDLSLY